MQAEFDALSQGHKATKEYLEKRELRIEELQDEVKKLHALNEGSAANSSSVHDDFLKKENADLKLENENLQSRVGTWL